MKTFTRVIGIAVVAGALFAVLPAKADVYFKDTDRDVLKSYVTVTPSTGTTTTTTKTTTTYYQPGTVIPDTVTYSELPTTVVSKLSPPPEGDTYVTIGSNAYLVDKDRKVVDAIRLED
ncbi:MAG TPA: hypothetical protein VL625_11005 [Patescibacteria group bacterium]|jgi:hypothetical protein|nr:hypothetical protein [Patescibacteria group bacterium]